MQSERVTFLTTPAHKAALDAFAASNRKSVGHVLREASSRYMAEQDDVSAEERAALELLAAEINAAVPKMQASLERSCALLDAVHAEMDTFLREKGVRT